MIRINLAQIDYENPLGKSGINNIYPYAKKDGSPSKWAVKEVVVEKTMLLKALKEAIFGHTSNHRNILHVKTYDIKHGNEQQDLLTIYLKIPRMRNSLENILKEKNAKNQYFSQEAILVIFSDIAQGLEYLHRKKISHRDLRPSNVQLNDDNIIKLSNIGGADVVIGEPNQQEHTNKIVYLAPEVTASRELKDEEFYKADMWSLGVVVLKLCLGPDHASLDEILSKVGEGELKEREISEIIDRLTGKFDIRFLGLIRSLPSNDPYKRLSAQELKQQLEILGRQILFDRASLQNEHENAEIQSSIEIKNQKTTREKMPESTMGDSRANVPTAESTKKEPWGLDEDRTGTKGEERLVQEYPKKSILLPSNRNAALKDPLMPPVSNFQEQNLEEIKDQHPETKIEKQVINECTEKRRELEERFPFKVEIPALVITLKEPDRITVEDLMGIQESISGCKKLSSLKLNLEGCSSINDHFIGELSSIIGKTKQLENFVLSLNGCPEISDVSMKVISDQFCKLVNLKQLELNLKDCPKVTAESAHELIKTITKNLSKNLKYLEVFGHSFVQCINLG